MARHTMATEICLTNGVPIETLSKMLGHTNIRTTQIYAKITHEKESRDMNTLSDKLSKDRAIQRYHHIITRRKVYEKRNHNHQ